MKQIQITSIYTLFTLLARASSAAQDELCIALDEQQLHCSVFTAGRVFMRLCVHLALGLSLASHWSTAAAARLKLPACSVYCSVQQTTRKEFACIVVAMIQCHCKQNKLHMHRLRLNISSLRFQGRFLRKALFRIRKSCQNTGNIHVIQIENKLQYTTYSRYMN